MVTVIGMWEPGYSIEQTFFEDTVWKQTLSAFNVNRFIMITYNEAYIENTTNPEQYSNMEDALISTEGERVFLTFSSENALSLENFSHPEDAVYIFGRPGDNLLQYIRPQDKQVHIDTPNNIDMLACSCVAAVLYARYIS
jgi:tRNA(Leu) C34 or U34 (ribose-2'-O)-methylase TrmL